MRKAGWSTAVALILVLLLVAGGAAWYFQRPWVQILGNNVLRTNAPQSLVADVENRVIEKHQNYVAGPNGTKSDPTFQSWGKSWSSGRSPQEITAELHRGLTEITDKNGHRLKIERISSSDMPTLVFVEFDDPTGPQTIVPELLNEFSARGVNVR